MYIPAPPERSETPAGLKNTTILLLLTIKTETIMKKSLLIAVAALFVAIGANAQVKWQRAMNVKQNRVPMAAHSQVKVADDASLMKPVKRTVAKRAQEIDGTYILDSQNWDGDFTESTTFTVESVEPGEVALWAPAGEEAEMFAYNVKLTDFTAEGGVAYGYYDAEESYIVIPAGMILGNSKTDFGASQDYGDVVFSACVTLDGAPQYVGYNMYLLLNEDGTVEIWPGDFSEEIEAGEMEEGVAITGFYNGCATDDSFMGNGAWNYGFECEVFIPNAILGTTECHIQSGDWTPWANASYPVCVEDYGTEMVVHNFFGLCPISINISGDKASVAVPVRVMERNFGTDEEPDYIQIWQWDENFENIINPGEITGNITVENGKKYIEFYDTEYKEAWTDEQGDHEAGNYIITDYTKWFMVHSTWGDNGAYWWGEARNVYLVMADETQGIAAPSVTSENQSTKLYDLQGRAVDSNYKGIVIKNGKKVVVK